jgi:predicted permease
VSFVDSLVQDLRHGIRLLFRHVGFTIVAVVALAVGIGVNTAVFTAYKAMVLRPLDARNPEEMVNVALVRPTGAAQYLFSYPDYEAYRDSARSFSGLVAFAPERMTLSQPGEAISPSASAADSTLGKLGLLPSGTRNAEVATSFVVSENYFKVLGVRAVRGTTFDALALADLVASPRVLISENYWAKRFSGSASIVGTTIRLNGVAVAIAGITPRDFMGTGAAVPDFWLPVHLAPLLDGDPNWLHDRERTRVRIFGRLAAGVRADRAQTEMTLLADGVRTLHDPRGDAAAPASAIVWRGSPFPLPLKMYPGLTLTILLIMSAAALVLVVACANVASLQLARARARLGELHTRLSMGATRARLVRQLLTESSVLGGAAASMALLLTWALLKVAVARLSDLLPPDEGTLIFDVTPDAVIFVYVLAVSLAASVMFGLTPALESSRTALAGWSRGSTSPTRNRRVQDLFVAVQVALTLVLLIAGSMLIRSAANVLRLDPGYDSTRLVGLDYQFPPASQYSPERKAALVRHMRAALLGLPGAAGLTNARPPDRNLFYTAAVSVDSGASGASEQAILHYSYVQPDYFETVGIPLTIGREFQSGADASGRSVVLSESAARLLWPGESPLGRMLRLGATDERPHDARELVAAGPAYRVVGVVRDIRGVEFDGSNSKHVYLPQPDDRLDRYPILIRANGDPARLVKAVGPVLASIDPDLLVTTDTLEAARRGSAPFLVSSLSAAVSVALGLLGLLLAAIGIYGTVGYMVAQRTREVGIRMALGAQARDVVGLILRESTRPIAVGLTAGMLFAVGASYVLRRILFAVSPVDAVSFAAASMLFVATALVAAFAPARRAAGVDPGVALRYE